MFLSTLLNLDVLTINQQSMWALGKKSPYPLNHPILPTSVVVVDMPDFPVMKTHANTKSYLNHFKPLSNQLNMPGG